LYTGTDRMTSIDFGERNVFPLEGQIYYVPDQSGSGRTALNRYFNAGITDHADGTNSPAGYTLEETLGYPWAQASLPVPPPRTEDGHIVLYDLKVEDHKDTLHLTRKLIVDVLLLQQKYYMALRNFFQAVRAGDEEQIVLQPGTTTAIN